MSDFTKSGRGFASYGAISEGEEKAMGLNPHKLQEVTG